MEKALDSSLKQDRTFWQVQQNEWGRGSGYKERIAQCTACWAVDNRFSETEVKIKSQSQALWNDFIAEIAAMIGVDFYVNAEN